MLDKLPANLAPKMPPGKGAVGRYVRIELPGKFRTLTLAEVEVYSDGKNVARQGKASQSSTASGGIASRAIDGNKSGVFGDGGQTHTEEGTTNPWWEVDLGKEFTIDSISIYNRNDGNLGSRLSNYTLNIRSTLATANETCKRAKQPADGAPRPTSRSAAAAIRSILVRRDAMTALTTVRGQETKTFQTLAKYRQGRQRTASSRHRGQLQAAFRSNFGPRTTPSRSLQFDARPHPQDSDEGAHRPGRPRGERARIRRSAGDSFCCPRRRRRRSAPSLERARRPRHPHRHAARADGVRQGSDRDAEGAKAVEFIFENIDLMPHNLVFAKPGSLEELGKYAEKNAQDPAFQARASSCRRRTRCCCQARCCSRAETAETEPSWRADQGRRLSRVCTYPGHWMRMHLRRRFYVVDNLDEYLANPDEYLAKNPLKIEDAALKDRRPLAAPSGSTRTWHPMSS